MRQYAEAFKAAQRIVELSARCKVRQLCQYRPTHAPSITVRPCHPSNGAGRSCIACRIFCQASSRLRTWGLGCGPSSPAHCTGHLMMPCAAAWCTLHRPAHLYTCLHALQAPAGPEALQALLASVASPMLAVSSAADTGRRSAFFNHLKALAETAAALSWLAYTGASCGTCGTGHGPPPCHIFLNACIRW